MNFTPKTPTSQDPAQKTQNATLAAALSYLKLGWVPIPIRPGAKTPLIKWQRWQNKRPAESVVKGWWGQWPDANVAILTGAAAGVIALDLENGADLEGRPVPDTVSQQTGGGGRHYLFRHPGFSVANAVRVLDKVDVRGDGGYIVVAPSLHRSGARYVWLREPGACPLAEPPDWLLSLLKARGRAKSKAEWRRIAKGVKEGERNDTLASYIGKVLARLPKELWETAGLDAALGFAARCEPPLDEGEARAVFRSIASLESAQRGGAQQQQPERTAAEPAAEPASWGDVESAFHKWLELSDLDPVRVVLATYLANKLQGDPVWLFLVAPPSSAKTEIVLSLAGLPDIYTLSTLTPNTFLSGKEARDGGGDISLLPRLNGRTLLLKDFAPILEMHRDTRQAIFAQLRDIYDGKHDRAVGSEKRTMRWEGRIGFIAGITQALDQFSGFVSLLGERFLQYRLPPADEQRTFRRAIKNIGAERGMRQELRQVVQSFLQTVSVPSAQEFVFPDAILGKLESLVRLVIRARTGVIRDWHGQKELIFVPDHEGPARLTKQLAMLLMGLATLRGEKEISLDDYRLVHKTGLDSLHKQRRAALELLAQEQEWATPDFAIELDVATTTAGRVLEDLTAVGIVKRDKMGDYKTAPDLWTLRPEILELWEGALP